MGRANPLTRRFPDSEVEMATVAEQRAAAKGVRGKSASGHRFQWAAGVDAKTMRQVERGVCQYCDQRALRDWVPGERGGQRMRTRYWEKGKLQDAVGHCEEGPNRFTRLERAE